MKESCACQTSASAPAPAARPGRPRWFWAAVAVAGLALWVLAYANLGRLADGLAFDLLGLSPDGHLGEAVRFFVFDTPKVLLLLVLIVFGVGVLRSFFTPEATRRMLAGKRSGAGHVLAALLGVATPFCSCSAVPLFVGFVTAGVPLGVTFSFLIAAPMVNEVALAMLFGLFGWRVALLYAGLGLAVAIVAGAVIGRLGMEGRLQPWVRSQLAMGGMSGARRPTWAERFRAGRAAVHDIVGKIWPFVLLGIGVGAAIHGWVPEDALARIMGNGTGGHGSWWSVPLAVLLGIPMYANAAGVVPVIQALTAKGAALGTALAFMMSTVALSLPEMLILKKVLQPRLIVVFVAVVGAGILLVGYVFNLAV